LTNIAMSQRRAKTLWDALYTLLVAEKARASYAQKNFNYKGAVTWDDGLNPYVTDPKRFMYIPDNWDGTLVVLGYGITYINKYTGKMELECLTTSSCATVKAARIWFPNSAMTDFSPECSYNETSNARSNKGGLKGLHGEPAAENEKRFLQNTLEFVKKGGKLIMLTNAVCVEESTVWEGVSDEVKERLFQLCHPCVLARSCFCAGLPPGARQAPGYGPWPPAPRVAGELLPGHLGARPGAGAEAALSAPCT
jgi:hypothetical protein